MSDIFSFDSILLRHKEEANGHVGGAGGRGKFGGLGGLSYHKKWMLRRVKGVETVYVPPAHYSKARRRKKNVIQARSEIYWSVGETTWMNSRPRKNLMAPMVLSLGSGSPAAAMICPTERMY